MHSTFLGVDDDVYKIIPSLPRKEEGDLQMALEEYLNLLLENPNFFNLLIVKNFLADGLQKVDIDETNNMMDYSGYRFDHPEIA